MRTAGSRQEIPTALLLVLTAWSLLATQALLAPRLGRGAAVLLSFAAVTALVLASRRRDGDRATGRAAGLAALAALAGFASYPVWIPLIGAAGVALGLRPMPPPPRPDDPLLLVATLGLAPVFEELLYRERLLLALRSRIGAGLAVAISSLLFALPHLEAWSVLATSLVGLALGALMLAGALGRALHRPARGAQPRGGRCAASRRPAWVLPEPLALAGRRGSARPRAARRAARSSCRHPHPSSIEACPRSARPRSGARGEQATCRDALGAVLGWQVRAESSGLRRASEAAPAPSRRHSDSSAATRVAFPVAVAKRVERLGTSEVVSPPNSFRCASYRQPVASLQLPRQARRLSARRPRLPVRRGVARPPRGAGRRRPRFPERPQSGRRAASDREAGTPASSVRRRSRPASASANTGNRAAPRRCSPVRNGSRSTPSSSAAGGSPATASAVAATSSALTARCSTLPRGSTPFQTARNGTRMPPSVSIPFSPTSG